MTTGALQIVVRSKANGFSCHRIYEPRRSDLSESYDVKVSPGRSFKGLPVNIRKQVITATSQTPEHLIGGIDVLDDEQLSSDLCRKAEDLKKWNAFRGYQMMSQCQHQDRIEGAVATVEK